MTLTLEDEIDIGRAQIRYMFDGDEVSVRDMRDDQTKVKAVLETAVVTTTMPGIDLGATRAVVRIPWAVSDTSVRAA